MDKYEVDEILNLAIMSKTPYLIVEGVDDIGLYEAIARSAAVNCEVYSVEMIDGLAGGNNAVTNAMDILNSLSLAPGKNVANYVLGIVDRDARYYRGEMPTLSSILCLDFYSIESHFASKSAIKSIINKITRISSKDEIDIDVIFHAIENNLSDVYYFSLDALKNAVDPTYQSVVGFSSNIGRRKDANTISKLQALKNDLDMFAASFNLCASMAVMRKFVKGTWLLSAFSDELYKEIEPLVKKCKSNLIKQCRMCELDVKSPCLYQIRDGFNKNSIYSLMPDLVGMPELQYIKDRMVNVAANAAK